MKNKSKKNISIIFILMAVAIVFFIGYNVRGKSTGFLFDETIMKHIHDKTNDAGIKGMKIFTNLGSKYFFIIAMMGLMFYYVNTRQRRFARLAFVSIGGSYAINAVLKLLFTRIRPLEYMLIEKGGYSFPSGHSMVSMSFYTTMTYIILDKVNNKAVRSIFWIINFVLVFMIGYSRLYLGVHWPTDVLAGFLMGFVVFYVSKETIRD